MARARLRVDAEQRRGGSWEGGMRVAIVICEAESWTFADGSSYYIHSAHRTIQGAEDRKRELRGDKCDARGDGRPHDWGPDPDDQDFCLACGSGWSIDEVELEE
jgi:hypothetical protein